VSLIGAMPPFFVVRALAGFQFRILALPDYFALTVACHHGQRAAVIPASRSCWFLLAAMRCGGSPVRLA
jgi:hypothetical protein